MDMGNAPSLSMQGEQSVGQTTAIAAGPRLEFLGVFDSPSIDLSQAKQPVGTAQALRIHSIVDQAEACLDCVGIEPIELIFTIVTHLGDLAQLAERPQ
jgi:hypothetical protein